jgi:hypothetical protein
VAGVAQVPSLAQVAQVVTGACTEERVQEGVVPAMETQAEQEEVGPEVFVL